jgi:hypothetical protein
MEYRKKITINFSIVSISIMILVILFLIFTKNTANANEMKINDIKQEVLLEIPSKEEIIMNGYPINENGQTYGPDVKDLNLDPPNLILAKGENGVTGYIYNDLGNLGVGSPEEAVEYNKINSDSYSIPLYLQDGDTIIGVFKLDKSGGENDV